MGKVDVFAISFTGDKKVFYPGEVLNGVVVLKLNKELKMRGIRLEFHGEARVRWSEHHGSGENRRTRTYHNNEIYINTLATLHGKDPGQSGDNPSLGAGEYSYPFHFLIPSQNLPTSFEGRYGHIRYWLKAIIDRPWRFDVTTKAAFSMIEFVDINTPQLVNPLQTEENRNVGCCCCVSGPLTSVAQVDRGGYCPGESIAVSVFVNNKTTRNLPGMMITLMQHVVFIASSGKQKHFSTEIKRVSQPGIPPGDDRHFPRIPVPIPAIPPTMSSCRCIRVWYEIQTCACKNTCSRKRTVRSAGCPCRNSNSNCTSSCKCGTKRKACQNKGTGNSLQATQTNEPSAIRHQQAVIAVEKAIETFITPLPEDIKTSLLIRLLSQGHGSLDYAQNLVSEIQNPNPPPAEPRQNLPWCICGICRAMPNEEENKCCNKVRCVTSYQAFHNQCIDQLSLTLAIRQRCDIRADLPDYSVNSFRKAAYRQYIIWKYGKLGRGNRKVVPSCVVRTVRIAYPSPDNIYMGYKQS